MYYVPVFTLRSGRLLIPADAAPGKKQSFGSLLVEVQAGSKQAWFIYALTRKLLLHRRKKPPQNVLVSQNREVNGRGQLAQMCTKV